MKENNMENRFDEKFFMLNNVKVTIRYGEDMEKAKLLQNMCNTLEYDLKSFIRSEIALAVSEARKRDAEYIRNMPQGEGIPGVADYLESLAKK